MTQRKQLTKLVKLAELVLDSRLSVLQAAARAKLECEAQLAGLSMPEMGPEDLQGVSAQLASLNYQRWADVRRGELHQQLARRTVAVIDARDAAREAFGKKQALGNIVAKRK